LQRWLAGSSANSEPALKRVSKQGVWSTHARRPAAAARGNEEKKNGKMVGTPVKHFGRRKQPRKNKGRLKLGPLQVIV
jgi:hypothetical protein